MEKSQSINRKDYEILIRKRGDGDYSSYCPQLNLVIKGTAHEEVHHKMEEEIKKHIDKLSKNE
jgi:flagellar motor component MotA